eukprot:5270061-Pyramimonas_sp.AAC.1
MLRAAAAICWTPSSSTLTWFWACWTCSGGTAGDAIMSMIIPVKAAVADWIESAGVAAAPAASWASRDANSSLREVACSSSLLSSLTDSSM